MPSAPHLDLTEIDPARTVVGPESLRKVLKQRGTFELLDRVVHFDAEVGTVAGVVPVRRDAWWAADHIPGRPLFPGALMIEAAAQLCTYHFLAAHPEFGDVFVGFGGLDGTRFRQTVEPDCDLLVVGLRKRVRSRMFTYSVQGYVDGTLVVESDVLGVIL
ncbi:MAG TPA: hypothetical protein VJP77_01120 [Planctomycetota bacterium]|nr:hypothetical protein [Planctomycetota bacterium]